MAKRQMEGQMTDEQMLRKYNTALVDIWYAFKGKVLTVSNADAYWDEVIQAFDKVANKYKGTEAEDFALRMSVAAVKALEDKYRKAAGI